MFLLMAIDQDNANLKVYIKVQNVQNVLSLDPPRQQKNHKKNKQIIVGSRLSDLCFLCFFQLEYVFYYFGRRKMQMKLSSIIWIM